MATSAAKFAKYCETLRSHDGDHTHPHSAVPAEENDTDVTKHSSKILIKKYFSIYFISGV